MKKILSILVMGLLVISMIGSVSAAINPNTNAKKVDFDADRLLDADPTITPADGDDGEVDRLEGAVDEENDTEEEADDESKMAKAQNQKSVEAKERVKTRIGEKEINSEVEVEEDENGKVQATMRNGNKKEIKVMPTQASERAIQALKLHNCREEDGCTIELKEVGEGNESKAAYEVKTQKKAKFLGLFNTEIDVEAQIDAETGEVINTKRPWWSFLASENSEPEAEADEVEETNENETILNATAPDQEPNLATDALAK